MDTHNNLMKYNSILITFFLGFKISFTQAENSFQSGEWLKFKISYSGWVKAGYSTLQVKNGFYKGDSVFHVIGKGKTTGAVKLFFKVNDRYESYFDKRNVKPYKFIRKIYEGGHTKNRIIEFDYKKKLAIVNDLKYKTKKSIPIKSNIQDMISAYYFLRNNFDSNKIRVGEVIRLNMFFDNETFGFRLKFLGKEKLKTKFGIVNCLKFRPYVIAGRVFKEQESVTLWVSSDKNKIPLKIKADLRVGSIVSELEAFKGLKHPFKIKL